MSILKVARMGHPVLRAKARALERSEIKHTAVQRLIDDMIETMIECHGVGLAAPQVHEGLRLFVAIVDANEARRSRKGSRLSSSIRKSRLSETRNGGGDGKDVSACQTSAAASRRLRGDQGSRPSIGQVSGSSFMRQGFPARVIQHETDHLDGVLFFDRMRCVRVADRFWMNTPRYWVKD